MVLGKDVGAESHSASQLELGKPLSTPDMSARDAEAMVDSMLLDSLLLDPGGSMRRSRRMVEAASFQEKEKARSFLREAMIDSLRRPLQVSL